MRFRRMARRGEKARRLKVLGQNCSADSTPASFFAVVPKLEGSHRAGVKEKPRLGARRGQDARQGRQRRVRQMARFHRRTRATQASGGSGGSWRGSPTGRARAFDKWASTVAERAVVRASLARTLARFANRAVAAAFATWTDSVTEARRLRSTLARVARGFPTEHCPQRGSGGQSRAGEAPMANALTASFARCETESSRARSRRGSTPWLKVNG